MIQSSTAPTTSQNELCNPSAATLQIQLEKNFAESNSQQTELFEKTTEIFQSGMDSVRNNIIALRDGFAQLIGQTAALEGRTDQLEIKKQAQEELLMKKEMALKQRLNDVVKATVGLQEKLAQEEKIKIYDVTLYMNQNLAKLELSTAKTHQAVDNTMNEYQNAMLRHKTVIESNLSQFSLDFAEIQEALSAMDTELKALNKPLANHGHTFITHGWSGASYHNYTSGPIG